MHKPNEDELKTFARSIAKAQNISKRAVRKRRQSGVITSKPAAMPQTMPNYEREVRFRPLKDKDDSRWNFALGVRQ